RTGVRRTLGTTAGPQSTVATVAGLTGSPVTFTATATVGSAGKLVVTQQPSATAASGAAFDRQPRVQVQDANGNDVEVAGRAITAELVSGPQGASLGGNTTVGTNAGGEAQFANLSISGPAGSYTLNFTGADLSGATSSAITLTAGAATRLAFTGQPSSTTAGAAISPPVQVTVQDALGQTVTGADNSISITFGTNPTGATLGGTRTASAVNGVATVTGLTVDRAGSGYTLMATASGLTAGTSSAFNVGSGGAASIEANNSVPGSTPAGGTVSPDPSVIVTDASGNPVSSVAVTFTAVGGGTVTGESQTTNAQGTATVTSWTIGSTAGEEYGLRATAAGVSGEVLFETTAIAGTAGKLTIETQPAATAVSGVALDPQPAVQLRDASDNPVAEGGVTVTASIASGSGATLGGATAVTNSSGRATFSGLTLTGTPGQFTIAFNAPGVSEAVSGTVTLGAGAATRLAMVTEPSATAVSGEALAQQPVMQLVDASGNPVAQEGVEVLTTIATGGGTLGGTTTGTTDAAGRATFTDLVITGSAGTRRLLFAAPGLTSVTSAEIEVTEESGGTVDVGTSTIGATPGTVLVGLPSLITIALRDQAAAPLAGIPIVLSSS